MALLRVLLGFASAPEAQGGTAASAAKNQAAQTLIGLLRQLALYVQTTIQSNESYGLAELLSSGFDAANTNRSQMPLATPAITGIGNSGTGQLTLRVTPVANARLYEAQSQTIPTPPLARAPWANGRAPACIKAHAAWPSPT